MHAPAHLAPPQTSRADMESAPTGMRARSFTHLHTKKACPKRQALRLFYSCAFSSLSRTKRHSSPMVKSSLSSLSSISSPIASPSPRQLDHILMVGAQVSQRCAAAQIARVAAELLCQQILQFFKGHSVFPLSLGSFVFLSYKPTAVPSRGKPATTAQIYCA